VKALVAAALLLAVSAGAATTNNDDACDVALVPAATLLLPYFEVDYQSPATIARTTLFTIQNTTALPQIARVTLWTDWSYPMLTFNVFLTGYDVQAISMYDIFARGAIPNTSSMAPVGTLSFGNDRNPHFGAGAAAMCSSGPATITMAMVDDLRKAFTGGTLALPGCASAAVGNVHGNAVGYATIDVVANCNANSPVDAAYFANDVLFDNVLTGDYQHINPNPATGNYAGGNPLVHIRAIPEGGPAGAAVPTNLPYTFYDRYTKDDRRQPLPSVFVPHYINGGINAFNTTLQIWREAFAAPSACLEAYKNNSAVEITEVVRFDEHENPTYYQLCLPSSGCHQTFLPSLSNIAVSNERLPHPSTSGDVAGWMYLNLNSPPLPARPAQAWVVTSMTAEGRYAVEMDAPALGNGCSPAPGNSRLTATTIGPAPNHTAAVPRSAPPATIDNDDSCDIALLPAATLLLPYFEVDLNSPQQSANTTLFTILNTSAVPQIARVTLWTDWSFPMLAFNIFLTGYDEQSINLYDVLKRGTIAPAEKTAGTSNATRPGEISQPNDRNPNFLPSAAAACSNLPGGVEAVLLAEVQRAFTTGIIASPGCTKGNQVGGVHQNAAGYATIDVVATCSAASPAASDYFLREILFDNVLTGDYQHIDPHPATGNYASGNPLVHIRAVPEGGAAGTFAPTSLPFTFYDLYTAGIVPRTHDRRQPLPSAFLPRIIQGGTGAFNTNVQIWREASSASLACQLGYRSESVAGAAEVVRFDEHENAAYVSLTCNACDGLAHFPSTSSVSSSSYWFPPVSNFSDVAGWLFLNLNNGGSSAYSAQRNYRFGTTGRVRPSQAWVVTSMFAEGRYAVEMDAVAVGNGCSLAPQLSTAAPIGPAANPSP
jgi:hypothetical protein